MKPRDRIDLTNRDLEILQFVFEQRAVSHHQISSRFFRNSNRSVAHFRMRKISKAGYLRKCSTSYSGIQTLFYSMTNKGLQAFAKNFRYEITCPSFKSDSINHDIGLVEIRKYLEKASMVVEYLSESVLHSCSDLIESEKFKAFSFLNSDAAIVVNAKNGQYQVAVEYEISDKLESRYAEKLTDYYCSPSVSAVFYICRNARIEKLIRKIDMEVGQRHEAKVFTCLEENIKNETEGLSFFNRNKSLFLLK